MRKSCVSALALIFIYLNQPLIKIPGLEVVDEDFAKAAIFIDDFAANLADVLFFIFTFTIMNILKT